MLYSNGAMRIHQEKENGMTYFAGLSLEEILNNREFSIHSVGTVMLNVLPWGHKTSSLLMNKYEM